MATLIVKQVFKPIKDPSMWLSPPFVFIFPRGKNNLEGHCVDNVQNNIFYLPIYKDDLILISGMRATTDMYLFILRFLF
jgi:hypothetical protein